MLNKTCKTDRFPNEIVRDNTSNLISAEISEFCKQYQSFPYENHFKCYGKLTSRSWPVLFAITYFVLMHTSVLLQNKKFLHRCSQIACTVTTMNIMWTQVTLHKHENLFTVLITLLKLFEFANLSFFFFFALSLYDFIFYFDLL